MWVESAGRLSTQLQAVTSTGYAAVTAAGSFAWHRLGRPPMSSTIALPRQLGIYSILASPIRNVASSSLSGLEQAVGASADTDRSTKSDHFNVRAFYLGSDVDIQVTAEKLSDRCLALRKDFVVVTLGPASSIAVNAARLKQLEAQLNVAQPPKPSLALRTAPGSWATADDPTAADDTQQQQDASSLGVSGRQSFFARLSRNPYQNHSDPPKRFPYPYPNIWRSDLITEPHLMHHVMEHGVMIAFKFGCTVFFKPTPRHGAARPSRPADSGLPGDASAATSNASPGAAAASASADSGAGLGADKRSASIKRKRERVAAEFHLEQQLMRAVRTAVTDPILTRPRTEEAHVVQRPSMRARFAKEPDRYAVPELDLGSLEIICRVIGQSAALDFYTTKVDETLRDFDSVLVELAANAGKPFFQRPFMMSRLRGGNLLATIAGSSIMYNKVVSKLGLLDTSRTAWESDDHDLVWKGLKRDYELEDRFENLLKKLDIFKEESRFILEVRNERGSAAAEKVIIILIALEIIVNAMFHIYH